MASKLKLDNDSVIERAKKNRQLAYDADYHNREEMVDDLRFAALDQWPEEVKRERKSRPMLTLDRLGQSIRQVTGDMQLNRPSIKVLPEDSVADPDTADVMEGLVREIEYRSQAQHVYMQAARFQVKCGYGVFRVGTDFTSFDAFDQDIFIYPVSNPLNWWFDPGAKQLTKHDGNFVIGLDTMTHDEFEREYPKKTPASWENLFTGEDKQIWGGKDAVTVAEYYEKVPVIREIVMLSNNQVVELDEITEQDRLVFQNNGIEIVKQRTAESYEIHYYKLTSFDVLEHRTLKTRFFPIIPVYGEVENIEGKDYIRGMVRAAKDPQRLYNYWHSSAAETIALQPKAPYIATMKQIKNYKRFWETANTSNYGVLPYEIDDKAPPPQRQAPPTLQAGFLQQASIAAEDIKAATGIYDASLGQQSNETSGRAIIARQQEADISNSHFMMNLSAAIEQCGRVIVDMIPHYYDTMRVIRVLGEDGVEKQEMINEPIFTPDGARISNDLTRGKYDVKIQVGPSYKTKRIEAANSLVELARVFPQLIQVAGDLVAKNLDLPGADELESRLRKLLPPGIIDDPEQDEQQQAAQLAQLQALQQQQEIESRKAISEINKNDAKATKDMAEAEGQALENAQLSNDLDREDAARALAQAVALLQQPNVQV